MLASPEQQEIHRRVEVTIAHSLMVHMQFLEAYIHFSIMYIADHILPVLTIKDLINKDGELTTPFKLMTGMKSSISHLHVLFFPCVLLKATARICTKALNMHHQVQKGFCDIFVGIPHHQKWYSVYVSHKWNIVSLYNVVFDESSSSDLAYMSQPY